MDISLSDILWVGGALLVFTAGAILFTHRAIIVQAVSGVMASTARREAPVIRVDPPVDQQSTLAVQRMAIAGNEVNRELNLLPEEAREIIRFQAKVEVLADLLADGQLSNKAKAIERTFHCARSGKPDSLYARVNRALEPMTMKPRFPELTPEQSKQRAALGLPSR